MDKKKKKKETIDPINKKDNKCFQCPITVALNNEGIGKHPERITKIKLFKHSYNREGTNYPLEKND